MEPPGDVAEELRRDFFAGGWRVEEDAVGGLVAVACSKSSARAGSLGCVRVDVVLGEEKPWNCDVRSLYCFCRAGRESDMVAALLERS